MILAAASQGTGGDDEARLRALLEAFDTVFIPFDKTRKRQGFLDIFRQLRAGGFALFVFEGTGFAVGLAAIIGRIFYRRPYVFSSGDAVAPYLGARHPLLRPLFELYERMLYRCCSGFIGWTPYLAGRALTMGATKAVTAPGWAAYRTDKEALLRARSAIRQQLAIPPDAVVFGLAGTLTWSRRLQYCYGAELVRAAALARSTPYVLIVGDGSGLSLLKTLAGEALGKTVLFTGRVARNKIPEYLAAMDIGSLPQSVDGVGSFRYTTKLSEYLDAGLCFVTNQIPMAYDLDHGNIWRLPGASPWSEEFLTALARLMNEVNPEQIAARKALATPPHDFDRNTQVRRVTSFIEDILSRQPAAL